MILLFYDAKYILYVPSRDNCSLKTNMQNAYQTTSFEQDNDCLVAICRTYSLQFLTTWGYNYSRNILQNRWNACTINDETVLHMFYTFYE